MHRTDAPGRQCTGACQGLGAPDPFPSHKPSPPSRAALFHQILSPKPSPPSSKKKPSPPSRTSAFSVLPLASLTRLRLLSLASLTRLRLSQRGVGRRRRSRCEMSGGLFRVNILFHIPPPLDLGVCV